MAYLGLKIDDTIPGCERAHHCIPAYPEYTSSTVFNEDFYLERRKECYRLVGGVVDYHIDPSLEVVTMDDLDCATSIEDIEVSGPTEIAIGEVFFYSLLGQGVADYVNDYHIRWTVPPGQASIWGYESDTVDVITVQIGGYQVGEGVITCTLTNRDDDTDVTVITQEITITPYSE